MLCNSNGIVHGIYWSSSVYDFYTTGCEGTMFQATCSNIWRSDDMWGALGPAKVLEQTKPHFVTL